MDYLPPPLVDCFLATNWLQLAKSNLVSLIINLTWRRSQNFQVLRL